MPLELDYYYGNEAEQYSFYRIPKVLFTDSRFKGVPVEAKVLYGLLLDRMALSVKNRWLDDNGRVYIIFTVADVMETLGCAEQKANKLLSELDCEKGVGLIERKRRGLGKPNVIYVKNFTDKNYPKSQTRNCENHKSENMKTTDQELRKSQTRNCEKHKSENVKITNQELRKSQIKNCENHKSGIAKITNQELRKSQTNNTDFNDTDLNDTDPSIHQNQKEDTACIQCTSDVMDMMDVYREQIKENISYDILVEDKPYDRERLDGFVELMAEVCTSSRKSIRINQSDMGTEVVKSRFLKLDSEHIRYVMECLDKNTTLVGNIRAYTLSALFNAPVTMSQYYSSLVSHDMAQGFCGG